MRLVEADDKEKRQRDELTYVEWGQKLSLHQYLAREQKLRATAWAKSNMQTWLLVDEAGQALSSCETFRMNSVRAEQPGHAYAIASVFTSENLRGKGYAAQMLQAVMSELERRDKKLQAFTLYSEIGDGLYSRLGFSARPSFERVIATNARKSSAGMIRLLSSDEILESWSQSGAPRSSFVVWPTSQQLDWHFERERIYASHLGQAALPAHGAAFGDALLVWVVDYKAEMLQALYFKAKTALEAQALIVKACEVAHNHGLSRFAIWESELFSGWDRLGIHAERLPLDDELAMIKMSDESVLPTDWTFISRSLWV